MLERAPREERGGNSRFTGGTVRVAYDGVDDCSGHARSDRGGAAPTPTSAPTRATQFFDDMARVTQYRADPDLVEILVDRSLETLIWMRGKGVASSPIYGRQAFKVDGSSSSGAG